MNKKMIVIGGGIAGLSAGCYAQMNGYESSIFEMHNLPGGLCTAWKRGDYKIDGCIHWLCGSAGDGLMNRMWNELGVLDGKKIVNHEIFTQIETGTNADKKTFIVYSDADKLNAHMKSIGPEDSAEIDIFTDLIKKFTTFPAGFEKPPELMGPKDFMQMMKTMKPFFADFKNLKKTTLSDYAQKFTNPHLKEGLIGVLGDIPDMAMIAVFMMLAWQHNKSAGYPVGGSLEFSRGFESKYQSLGGTIQYSKTVKEIIVKKNRAVGIRLEDGTEHFAELIVSAADGYKTIFKMLSGKYVSAKNRKQYDTLPIFEPLFCLSLGIKRDFSAEPPMSVRILKTPIVIENKTMRKIGIKHFCFDPTAAPAGKSVVQIMYTSSYDHWAQLKSDSAAYNTEKKIVAEKLISALEEFYPGIRGDIEVTDMATPVTFERYTGNRSGTFEGWLLTPSTLMLRMKKTLPGLKNFYMIGQWVQPGGGLPSALKSGRDLIYILCRKDKKVFTIK